MRMIIAVMVVMISVIKAIIQMNLVITMLTVKMAANKTDTDVDVNGSSDCNNNYNQLSSNDNHLLCHKCGYFSYLL